jgi:hypothetical protein
VLKAHVANVCFTCFRRMLQVFYNGVANVDWDAAHIATAIYVCFKCMFQLFQTYVASVSSGYCKNISECCIYMYVASVCLSVFSCFKLMFQVFHLDVYILQWLHMCFSGVSYVC